jgi:uncharacterized protein YbjT (DUF2867 family)
VEVVQADTRDPASLAAALTDVQALVVVTGTTAFPTKAWRGGNTPKAVDAEVNVSLDAFFLRHSECAP